MLALFDIYVHKYDLLPYLAERQPGERELEDGEDEGENQGDASGSQAHDTTGQDGPRVTPHAHPRPDGSSTATTS